LAQILEIWRYAPRDPPERIMKLQLLKKHGLLGSSVLARETLAADPDVAPAQATRELVSLASDGARFGRLDDAIRYLNLLLEKNPLPAVKAASLVSLGALRRHQGQFTHAVKLLRGAVGLDEDASADAEWELGHALLAGGDNAEALAAYQRAREYPFPRCCIGDGEATATFHLYTGLSLESMGRTREAVEHYLQARGSFPVWWRVTLAGHLVDLYANSGQLDLLEAMLGAPAEPTRVEPRMTMGFERPFGLHVLRGAIELRRAEETADWETLASSLPTSRVGVGPETRQIREQHWRAAEAARLLARHPEALPVLSRRLIAGGEGRAPVWAFYALGLMGTPEALALLSEQAMRADRLPGRNLLSLLWAMGLTPGGRTARQALVERETLLKRLLEDLPVGIEVGHAELDAEFAFPPPPLKVDLPRELPPMPDRAPVRRRTRANPCLCS
jgi:tetratricopeptide (TPR) repeat protein